MAKNQAVTSFVSFLDDEYSKIKSLARKADGDIVQMSMAYWPKEVAKEVANILHERMGFEHSLVRMPRTIIKDYLVEAMKTVPLENFLPNQE